MNILFCDFGESHISLGLISRNESRMSCIHLALVDTVKGFFKKGIVPFCTPTSSP